MSVHETFTSNQDLAFLLGPPRPDFNLGNTWFGSVSIWAGVILNSGVNANPVVEVPVTGIPGITAVQAEVFGTRTYDENGLTSVMVSMIEWRLPGSASVLARYTFASPIPFPISASRFVGDWRFVDILQEVINLGGTPQSLFDDYFNGQDTLIGGSADDTMYGGNSDDLLNGGAGNDSLRGDAGNDTFEFNTGDAASGDRIDGGSGTDSVRVIGGTVSGVNTGVGVDLSSITITSVEQILLNGTEAVINVGQLAPGGFNTFIARTGFVDQLTILNADWVNLNGLSIINWDLGADRMAVVGTAGQDFANGSIGMDIYVGLGGADTFTGGSGDDRMLIVEDDTNPQDSFSGGAGNDVLQVDSVAIGSLMVTPLTDLRGISLDSVEVLDIVKGSFFIDGADFVGSISGTQDAPVTATVGLNRIKGNDSFGIDQTVVLQIEAGTLLGVDLRGVTFEDWNDGSTNNNLVRIIAGAQTQVIYGANEYSRIVAAASTLGTYIVAGTDTDEIIGSDFQDYLLSSDGDDLIQAMSGNDLIDAGIGADLAYGGFGNDTVGGADGNDSLYGDANDDFITGAIGNDQLDGGEGGDILNGGAGSDVLTGGGGFDFAIYNPSTVGVRVDLSNAASNTGDAAGDTYSGIEGLQGSNHSDTLVGDGQDNVLYGLNGNDLIQGGGGGDQIYGHAGDDVFIGGAGADRLDGDVGRDRVQYTDAAAGLRVDLQVASTNTGIAAGDLFYFIEDVYGSFYGDTLLGDTANNIIWGDAGNDAWLDGRIGNDTVHGGAGNDVLVGGQGADVLDGGVGSRDRAQYADATTGLRADLQVAQFNTGFAAGDTYIGIEDLYGSSFGDTLLGDTANNMIWGDAGDDKWLDGRIGNDTLYGGAGNDVLVGGQGADVLDGGVGSRDRAQYADATTGLRADLQVAQFNTGIAAGDTYAGIEDLYGSSFGDTLLGDTGGNLIWGAAGNDLIDGRLGNDTLIGGAGQDTLTGGSGADVFVFETALGAGNIDSINGYSLPDDTIQLENAIFTALAAGGLSAAAFATGATATSASHRILYDAATGHLLYDADGTGATGPIHFATLSAGLVMTVAEFLVV